MATPFKNPRDGILYFRREVPEKLRPAFNGKREVKVSLGTRDATEAKAPFARENARFEECLADARRRLAEGTLLPTPGALVRRWCEAPAVGNGLTGPQRLMLTFMELDAAVGARYSASAEGDIFPPAIIGPAINTPWPAVLADKSRFEAIVTESYGGDLEQTGTNWIRTRWHTAEGVWMPGLAGPVARLRAFEASADRFSDDELAKALLAIVDEKRTSDEDVNRARLSRHRPRAMQSRLRPHMRLKQLFCEWQDGNKPRPQTALECEAAINDFIDFAGDIAVSTIDPDLLYDYRDEASKLPASMPRADRILPFRARVAKHANTQPKCAPPTLKKRIGALQALLTYAFQQRWTATNVGAGIRIVGYTKTRRTRRSFEDHELAKLFACPLFVDPLNWGSTSRISEATIFWLFLLAITTGARLEEVGQVALADVKRDGKKVYLDIDEYVVDENVDYGADCKREMAVGQRVVGLPFIAGPQGVELIGYSNHFNGAFAEEMLLQEDALFAVPDNVSTDVAALAEPLSVAVRAVATAAPTRDSAFAVYGCGPVGLFVIARLRHLGFGPILAIDPDPQRRAFAERLGADIVIAPAADEIARWWEGNGAPLGISDATAARGAGNIGKRPVIFECVGKPGILKSIAEQAPVGALVVVVGVCMEIDQVEPGFIVQKELQLRFTFAYDQNEFAEATQMIAKNPDWLAPLVIGHVTLDNVEDAFDMLERGGAQAKVLIRPS